MPTLTLPMARAAGLIEVGPALRAALAKSGCDVPTAQALDGVDQAVSDGLLADLQKVGISLGSAGMPLETPLAEVQGSSAMRPPSPQEAADGRDAQARCKEAIQ